MSLLTRFRRPTNPQPVDATGQVEAEATAADDDRRTGRLIAARITTVLAGLLVLFALLVPNDLKNLTPAAFVRIPVEALAAAAVLLALPGRAVRARRAVAVAFGFVLGLLMLVKAMDMGFFSILARQFDPVLDWTLLDDAVAFLSHSVGRAGAIGAAVAAAVLAIAVPFLLMLSVWRLARVMDRHRVATVRAGAVVAAAWIGCAVLGLQVAPGVPVASRSAAAEVYDNARQVRAGLKDQQTFAAAAAQDAFRDTPGDQLLTALRGKDVVFTFVESYGRDAVENPEFAPQVGALLDDGTRRLAAKGFQSRSGFLTSSTYGGYSWLAHSTFLSGLWVDNQQRYRSLVASDRLTLTGAFRRAEWRTVGVMPGITYAWPEGHFYGYDQVYDSRNLGYRGPKFGWATMPDQYTLSAFERLEHAAPDRRPLMVEVNLISSHVPWAPLPRLVGWNEVGDGSGFATMATEGATPEEVWRDPARVRAEYRRSIEYTLNSLISYVETYGDDDLVLVFLGDHQPAPIVTGDGASHDVPITIVTRDRAVLDRIAGWGWQDGLRPGPQAPVWRMDAFRDRFLTAFGPQAAGPSSDPPGR